MRGIKIDRQVPHKRYISWRSIFEEYQLTFQVVFNLEVLRIDIAIIFTLTEMWILTLTETIHGSNYRAKEIFGAKPLALGCCLRGHSSFTFLFPLILGFLPFSVFPTHT